MFVYFGCVCGFDVVVGARRIETRVGLFGGWWVEKNYSDCEVFVMRFDVCCWVDRGRFVEYDIEMVVFVWFYLLRRRGIFGKRSVVVFFFCCGVYVFCWWVW